MRKRASTTIKQCLVLCFSFALAALTVSTIYINSIDESNHLFLKERKKHLNQLYEADKGPDTSALGGANTNGSRLQNGSLLAQPAGRDSPHASLASVGHNRSHSGVAGVRLNQGPLDGRPLKNDTPDPLYDHPGYIGVLNSKKILNLHCTQCAYVSSSGQLLESHVGYLIDEADCVFRMNDAPTPGYEEDVGSRTTVRVVGHASVYNLRNKRQPLIQEGTPRFLVGWGPAKHMQTNGKGYAYKVLKELATKYKNVEFFYLTEARMKKADEIFEEETGRPRMGTGTYLSTGWFTMVLARQVCDEIHVYGMINEEYCTSKNAKNVPYHYYNPRGMKECSYYKNQEKGKKGVHRFITEKSVFTRWAREQPPIFFHVPDWDP